VFFHGRKSLTDPNPAGTGEIRLHEIKSDSRQFVGKVDLKSWNDLWFFNYRIFNPAQDVAMIATACAYSKLSNTIKAHVTYGHASGRRVHGAFKHDNRGDDIFSDLPCLCPICAVTKSETPGHRKFERHFQHTDIDVTKVKVIILLPMIPECKKPFTPFVTWIFALYRLHTLCLLIFLCLEKESLLLCAVALLLANIGMLTQFR
jgi:hypothetical protein